MSDDLLRLTATDGVTRTTAEIDMRCGGRVRQVRVERGDEAADLLATSPEFDRVADTSWGSFPMVPWAGRLRHGRFVHDGVAIGLELNHQDGDGVGGGRIEPPAPAASGTIDASSKEWRRHAIHGTTYQRPWVTVDAVADRCEIRCPIDTVAGWPFAGVAHQVIRLHPDRIEFSLSVEAIDGATFPAAIGWHPWFAKPIRLEATPSAMYVRDEVGLPTGALIDPPPGPWDDCFLNDDPIRLVYERNVAGVVTVTSDCDHLVLYDQPSHATCVEPQSGPPDAANLRPEVASPGSPLRRTMSWSWSD